LWKALFDCKQDASVSSLNAIDIVSMDAELSFMDQLIDGLTHLYINLFSYDFSSKIKLKTMEFIAALTKSL